MPSTAGMSVHSLCHGNHIQATFISGSRILEVPQILKCSWMSTTWRRTTNQNYRGNCLSPAESPSFWPFPQTHYPPFNSHVVSALKVTCFLLCIWKYLWHLRFRTGFWCNYTWENKPWWIRYGEHYWNFCIPSYSKPLGTSPSPRRFIWRICRSCCPAPVYCSFG